MWCAHAYADFKQKSPVQRQRLDAFICFALLSIVLPRFINHDASICFMNFIQPEFTDAEGGAVLRDLPFLHVKQAGAQEASLNASDWSNHSER
jgi:hypothetical protein